MSVMFVDHSDQASSVFAQKQQGSIGSALRIGDCFVNMRSQQQQTKRHNDVSVT